MLLFAIRIVSINICEKYLFFSIHCDFVLPDVTTQPHHFHFGS